MSDPLTALERRIRELESEPNLLAVSRDNLRVARTQLVLARLAEASGLHERAQGCRNFAERALRTIQLAEVADDARRGHKVQQGARDGHAATHGTEKEKQARSEETRDLVARLQRENPALRITEARRRAGKMLGISYSTVRRHTD